MIEGRWSTTDPPREPMKHLKSILPTGSDVQCAMSPDPNTEGEILNFVVSVCLPGPPPLSFERRCSGTRLAMDLYTPGPGQFLFVVWNMLADEIERVLPKTDVIGWQAPPINLVWWERLQEIWQDVWGDPEDSSAFSRMTGHWIGTRWDHGSHNLSHLLSTPTGPPLCGYTTPLEYRMPPISMQCFYDSDYPCYDCLGAAGFRLP